MAGGRVVVFVFLSSFFVYFTVAVPEKGIEVMDFDQNNQQNMFSKSLFKDATLIITTETPDDQKDQPELALHWSLYISDCAQAFMRIQVKELPMILASNHVQPVLKGNATGLKNLRIKIRLNKPSKSQKLKSKDSKQKPKGSGDGGQGLKSKDSEKKPKGNGDGVQGQNAKETKKKPKGIGDDVKGLKSKDSKKKPKGSGDGVQDSKKKKGVTGKRSKRSAKADNETSTTVARPPKNKKLTKTMEHGKDGNYLLVVEVSSTDKAKPFKVQVTVKMKSNTGYLSAAEWPLLPFYGGMSLVYLAYGVVWLIVSACQWRELLRIQFWIGGVIALGMLEKAVLFSEYSNVNNTGIPAHGLVVFAQVLSCIKRTLSRILIIIVSMGFGIVKPRLGAALHRVLGVAFLYFILCVIEGSYREITVQADITRRQLLAAVPLSVLDAVICWWIFMSLMQTMRTLRIRKNVVKLSLYRHFTNILAVAVVASVAFMIWVIRAHHFNPCIKDWKELWIDDAFWHFLFALVLLAIMILWRPTANNQRYAFTPLIDVGDDDNDDMTLSDAFHGMKMRNKSEGEAPSRAEKNRSKLEDDLKWVEENIPTAGGIDTALPTLLDSDEEVMTTKLEMSKME